MIELDRIPLEVECPQCKFFNGILYRDARLRDVLICRGCKQSIRLDDHMNQCRKARVQVRAALQELEASVTRINRSFTIRL